MRVDQRIARIHTFRFATSRKLLPSGDVIAIVKAACEIVDAHEGSDDNLAAPQLSIRDFALSEIASLQIRALNGEILSVAYKKATPH